jgi:hypothetical protein
MAWIWRSAPRIMAVANGTRAAITTTSSSSSSSSITTAHTHQHRQQEYQMRERTAEDRATCCAGSALRAISASLPRPSISCCVAASARPACVSSSLSLVSAWTDAALHCLVDCGLRPPGCRWPLRSSAVAEDKSAVVFLRSGAAGRASCSTALSVCCRLPCSSCQCREPHPRLHAIRPAQIRGPTESALSSTSSSLPLRIEAAGAAAPRGGSRAEA